VTILNALYLFRRHRAPVSFGGVNQHHVTHCRSAPV
jgi:hypothetical protein